MWLVPILFSLVNLCFPCKDQAHCNEVLNVRYQFISLQTKCSFWTFALAPDLFPSQMTKPVSKRLMMSEYCPRSCGCPAPAPAPPAPSTTTVTSTPTTIRTTTTIKSTSTPTSTSTTTTTTVTTTEMVAAEKVLDNILEENHDFRDLLATLPGNQSVENGLARYQMYLKGKKDVEDHNLMFEQGLTTYKMAVNSFTLKTPSERPPNGLKADVLAKSSSDADILELLTTRSKRQSTPSVDWRDHMKPVEDQGVCGGCWAFAMNAMIEGFLSIKGSKVEGKLSVQQLLDCDRSKNLQYGVANKGCDGGYFQVATAYYISKGITSSDQYPFESQSSSNCRLKSNSAAPRIANFHSEYVQTSNETVLEALDEIMESEVTKGPVAIGMAVAPAIYSYGQGVYDGECGNTINHAVVIVGFTPEYWIIRNSWGTSWGEDGHIRIARNVGRDPCHLLRYWSRATVVGTWEPPTTEGPIIDDDMKTDDPATGATSETPSTCCDGDCCDCCDECDCEDEDDEYEWEEDSSSTTKWTTTTTSSSSSSSTTVYSSSSASTTVKSSQSSESSEESASSEEMSTTTEHTSRWDKFWNKMTE